MNGARQASSAPACPNGSGDDHQHGCGSGLEGHAPGRAGDQGGDAEIVIAGGQESMSLAPHVMMGSREGFAMGDGSSSTRYQRRPHRRLQSVPHGGSPPRTWRSSRLTRQEQTRSRWLRSQKKPRPRRRRADSRTRSFPIEIREKGRAAGVRTPTSIPSTARRSESISRSEPASTRTARSPRPMHGHKRTGPPGHHDVLGPSEATGLKPLAARARLPPRRVDPKIMGMGPCPPRNCACPRPAGRPPIWT